MAATAVLVFLGLLGLSLAGLITNLPNAPAVTFKQYAGYFNVSRTHHMHYWFVESQSNPATDPVLIWLTGGPGCSGFSAILTEYGPFTVQPDGKSLKINPYSWNRKASILTVESPVGVGWSYADDGDVYTNDDQTALENWQALKGFFTEFPQYRTNEFYIAGESYAGIYIPTLADTILKKQTDFNINLKGMAIGNGCVSDSLGTDTVVQYAYNHGMVDEKTWQKVKDECCDGKIDGCAFSSFEGWGFCATFVQETVENTWYSGINPYDMYGDCSIQTGVKKAKMARKVLTRGSKFDFFRSLKALRLPDSRAGTICLNEMPETTYLNQAAVKTALFVKSGLPAWEDCSSEVRWEYETLYDEMQPFVKNAIDKGVRVLVYNGDTDLVCNFLMGQRFTMNLGYPQTSAKKTYEVEGQVGGFHTQYGIAEFVTVRGAGHMVPTDRPATAWHMIDAFLNKRQP